MGITDKVRQILDFYDGERPGVKANLARMLMHGKPGGSGKLVILPVDQGFEHGPTLSFAANPPAYDPHYLFELAIDAGLSAFAAPLGLLTCGADKFAGAVPFILKANSGDNLAKSPDQAVTGTVRDALELGCSAIGFTIYPSSEHQYDMFEEVRVGVAEAKAHGLAVVIWAYPRGGTLSKEGETALDIVAHSAQIAALLGAHIIKVKPPTSYIERHLSRAIYADMGVDFSQLRHRIAHIMQSAFNGRRIVVFSGGPAKDQGAFFDDVRAIRDGGGHGSIVGRNSFQRPRDEALDMLDKVTKIYLSDGSDGA